ncbi:Na+/H+ antiporter NhaA [Nonomuraea dietziae]|uniref:Na+/H+ antiporter NhaA n=1 Tax=Nonomuraea dietziae TaxID=65515 RepID=UPI003447D493
MLRAFFRTEVGSTTVLLAATLLGLLWANSPWAETYDAFRHIQAGLAFGDTTFELDLRHWVNDGLMAVFFFVIGLEISREVTVTLVGIALGALVFVYAPSEHKLRLAGEAVQELAGDPSPRLAREAALRVKRSVSINERLQLMLHPWSSYVIVPIFALANAGVRLDTESLRVPLLRAAVRDPRTAARAPS